MCRGMGVAHCFINVCINRACVHSHANEHLVKGKLSHQWVAFVWFLKPNKIKTYSSLLISISQVLFKRKGEAQKTTNIKRKEKRKTEERKKGKYKEIAKRVGWNKYCIVKLKH